MITVSASLPIGLQGNTQGTRTANPQQAGKDCRLPFRNPQRVRVQVSGADSAELPIYVCFWNCEQVHRARHIAPPAETILAETTTLHERGAWLVICSVTHPRAITLSGAAAEQPPDLNLTGQAVDRTTQTHAPLRAFTLMKGSKHDKNLSAAARAGFLRMEHAVPTMLHGSGGYCQNCRFSIYKQYS